MQQTDERSWRAVETQVLTSDAAGEVHTQFPCDLRLSLHSPGWMWANQPNRVVVREGMGPIQVQLLPELTVRLFVHGGDGPKAQNVRFHRPGDEVGQPVPHQGLMLYGLQMSEVAGEIRSSNLPTRSWRPARSDQLADVQPGLVEAVVIVGAIQKSWLQISRGAAEGIEGVLCVADGVRGKQCKFYQGVWRCPCGPPASLGLYGSRWAVGLIRPLQGADMQLDSLPEVENLCLALPQVKQPGATLIVQPRGVDGGLLLGGLPYPVVPDQELCLRLPRGEDVDLTLRGTATGSWTVNSRGQGRMDLSSL